MRKIPQDKFELLISAKRDMAMYGSLSKATVKLYKDVVCSKKVFDLACLQGAILREKIKAKHKIDELKFKADQARYEIGRAIATSTGLDLNDKIKLKNKYEITRDAYDVALAAFRKECNEIEIRTIF